MRTDKIRKDNRIGQLELALSQKSADIQHLSDQIKKVDFIYLSTYRFSFLFDIVFSSW